MSQSSTHMLCSTFVSAKIRHGNLKTSVFNFCGSMLPGFADFNAKNNKKNWVTSKSVWIRHRSSLV